MMSRNENNARRRPPKPNVSPMPRSRMQRQAMPHTDNMKSQSRDVYSNPRFCDMFAKLKGSEVLVQVNSGTTYEGILHTISPKGEVVLIDATTKDLSKQQMGTQTLPSSSPCIHLKLLLKHSDIVKITAKDVDLNYSNKLDSFATDSEISQRINGQIVQRKLEAWDPVEDEKFDEKLRDAELGGDGFVKGNGWDATEMFALNSRNFGYQSTYQDNLQEYTTPLEEEDTKEYRERKARAEKLAKQIEQSPEHATRGQIENNDEMTEEDKYGAVQRPGRSVPQNSSSNNIDKYVPPQRRQPGGSVYHQRPGARPSSSGPGRPPMPTTPVDRQPPPQPQPVVNSLRHTHQPSKQQQQQQQQQQQAPPPAGPTGAMPDFVRNQPHHSQQHQPKSQQQHHHSPAPPQQQSPYQQRSPVAPGITGSREQSPSLGTMGTKSIPSVDNEPKRVTPLPEKQPLPSSEVTLQRPDALNHQSVDANRTAAAAAPAQIPPLTPPPEGQNVTEKNSSRSNITRELKTFSENYRLSSDSDITENKVPAHKTPLPATGELPAETISPTVTTRPLESSAQSEMKAAGTTPVSPVVPKKTPVSPTVEKERIEVEKVQSPEKQESTKLNPNAKPFVPRAQKTPTPPPSRSPASQMPTNQMIHTYMGPGIFPQVGPLMVASNDLRPYAVPKPQVPQPPRANIPRVDYFPHPMAATGQPIVSPMAQGQQYITVSTGGQGIQQAPIKVMTNHFVKPPVSYRALTNNNPAAISAMHPQSAQQLVQSSDVILPHMMAFSSQAAHAPSQPLQQQQGSAPSNQFMHAHTAPSHANAAAAAAANQMQQSHHTTPPLQQQQSQQPQSSNHPVIAPQGQFPQHGGRPSPGPMQPQMAHAQAQAQVVHPVNQPQGGMPQLVAVSQGGQPAIVYTSLQQTQHGHGIPQAQHAGQQYTNLQHLNQPQSMQVPPTHVPSNMANITNVTRVHSDPHPHPQHAAATAALYNFNQPISNQPGMVQSHQLPGSFMQQHGTAFPPGN